MYISDIKASEKILCCNFFAVLDSFSPTQILYVVVCRQLALVLEKLKTQKLYVLFFYEINELLAILGNVIHLMVSHTSSLCIYFELWQSNNYTNA